MSHLSVRQEQMLRFRAASRKFELSDSVISAGRAGIALYTSTGDSITHPGVELKYLKGKEQLKLLYEKGLYRNAPYSDSYHQVDIRAQMLVWNLREPKMDFSIITTPTQISADFESKNFFPTPATSSSKPSTGCTHCKCCWATASPTATAAC
ncbi:MAG: hypothetical protein WKG07_01685 [Hymenobacter sp.]